MCKTVPAGLARGGYKPQGFGLKVIGIMRLIDTDSTA